MPISKTILNHSAVQDHECGEIEGSDYKYDVFLKDGYIFQSGRMKGCRGGFFNSLKEFKDAKPVKGFNEQYD